MTAVYFRGLAGALALALVAAVVDSCSPLSGQAGDDPAPPPTVPAPALAPSPPPPSADGVGGVWEGRYECVQGVTGLTLSIAEAADGRLAARFSFYPVPENAETAAGVFTMEGEHSGGRVLLRPGEWIEQPTGWLMVGLDGNVSGRSAPRTIAGRVGHSGCSRFVVEQVAAEADPAQPPISAAIAGTWEGDYDCGSTRRGLRLVVTPAEDGRFQATFDFSPLAGAGESESGSYAMVGYVSRNGMLAEPDRWIDQPPGYVMVGMSAELTEREPDRITGEMVGPNCRGFTIDRVSDQWQHPAG